MKGNGHLHLQRSLALAGTCLYSALNGLTLSAGEDPLRLNLPSLLVSGGEGIAPNPAELRVIATLYLQAELEQAGIVPVAEMLAQARTTLTFASRQALEKLEDFALRSRHWYDRETRDLLFARLFSIGRAATNAEGNIVNRDFQQRFATFCLAIEDYNENYGRGQQPEPIREATLRGEATNLLINLGARQFGNTVLAAGTIQAQLQHAIDLLENRDIGALFQAQGLWDILRKILGPETPDLARLIDRGQSGLWLLDWLASVIPQISEKAAFRPLLPAGSPVFVWATTWLKATGFEMNRAGTSPSPYGLQKELTCHQ